TFKVVTKSGVTPFDCSGPLQIDPSNAKDVATFEVDFVKSGGKLTSKATLYADSPLYLGGTFTTANCASKNPLPAVVNSPPQTGPKPVAVKIDLAQIAKAKGKTKTYNVGETNSKTGTNPPSTTNWNWNGTVTLTLRK